MFKKALLFCFFMLIVFSGCQPTVEEDYTAANEQLKALLPNENGFVWVYSGFAEYGHAMELMDIETTDSKTTYTVEGEVEDVSGGEATVDFDINLQYIIESGELRQVVEESVMMDEGYDSLILIKTPLEVGTAWEQTVVNENGENIELSSMIEQITATDLGKTYKVRYQDKNSDYYETRVIREGTGVIAFSKLFMSGKDNFEIGYYLYEEASGKQ